jgi:hypothetical protein
VEELRVKSATGDSSDDAHNVTGAAFLSIANSTLYTTDAPFLKNRTISLPAADVTEQGWVPSSETCIYVYIGLILAIIFLIILRVICFFTMCTRASVRLHDTMFSSITHATMAFFSNNPSGNRNVTLGCVGLSLRFLSILQSVVMPYIL